MLTDQELERYRRQILLPEIGVAGQERLKSSRALVVGAGGLGSPICVYLAAAGVGTIGIVDSDTVGLSNLNRQVLYGIPDLGRQKAETAAERLTRLNPEIRVRPMALRLTASNAAGILQDYDVLVDGTDNVSTRLMMNRAAREAGIPCVFGGVNGLYGQVMTVLPGSGPCLACLLGDSAPPVAGGEIPVLGGTPGVIGCLQSIEAVKLLLNIGRLLVGRLMTLDLLNMRFDEILLRPDPACPVCGR